MDDIHSEKSVVDEKFRKNTYRNLLPIRLFNYWLNKLFSEKPNISVIDKNGKDNEEGVKRIWNILERSNFRDVIAKYLSKKSLGEGYGALTFHLVEDIKYGTIPIFKVAEGVVRYNSFLETTTEIQVVERLTRGIVPILRIKTYGKMVDKITYELGDNFNLNSYEGSDKKDIENLLKTSKNFVHNFGFVRAIIFRNRVDDNHYDYGQNDLNGFEDFIDNIDLTNNRALNEIDQNTTHISRTLATGTILGDEDKFINGTFENQNGMVKEMYSTLDTEEGLDSVVIGGTITLSNLRETIREMIGELDQMTGIQVGYDSLGKTNDTSTKSNMIGDPAHKEASLRKLVEEEFWTKALYIAIELDKKENGNIWNNIESISFKPRINDFRTKIEMLNNIDKISKYYPLKEMYKEMLDVSPQVAQDMIDNKEKEMKKYMVSALPAINGNIPQNLSVDFDWAETIEKEQLEEDDQVVNENEKGVDNEKDN